MVIIGGGIMGLSLAYNLAGAACSDVVVLEQGYLCAGASGRNGGGVRAQWSTPTMVRLGQRSLELFAPFAREMGINVWFRRGGYLFLAPDGAQVERLERNAALQRAHGVPTRILSPDEAREVVPELDRGASWPPPGTPTTASSSPGPSCGATPRAAEARGREGPHLHPGHRLRASRAGRVRAVETDRRAHRAATRW